MPPFQPEMFNVSVERFRDAEPVQRQQTRQRVIPSAAKPGLDQEHAALVAIQPDRVRHVAHLRSPDVGRR